MYGGVMWHYVGGLWFVFHLAATDGFLEWPQVRLSGVVQPVGVCTVEQQLPAGHSRLPHQQCRAH